MLVVMPLLSRCATVSNSLSPAEIGQIRIEAVKVTVKHNPEGCENGLETRQAYGGKPQHMLAAVS